MILFPSVVLDVLPFEEIICLFLQIKSELMAQTGLLLAVCYSLYCKGTGRHGCCLSNRGMLLGVGRCLLCAHLQELNLSMESKNLESLSNKIVKPDTSIDIGI